MELGTWLSGCYINMMIPKSPVLIYKVSKYNSHLQSQETRALWDRLASYTSWEFCAFVCLFQKVTRGVTLSLSLEFLTLLVQRCRSIAHVTVGCTISRNVGRIRDM